MAAKKPAPKVGEIRIGAKGNKSNKWDGKKWVPVSAARTGGGSSQNKTTSAKPKTTSSSPRVEGPKTGQKVTRVGSTVKLGPAKYTKPKQKTPNRPTRNVPMQIATSKSGEQRWVKYVKPKGKK